MGDVLKLKTKPFPQRQREKPQFLCLNCQHEQFLLFPDKSICCANCGLELKNLKLGEYHEVR